MLPRSFSKTAGLVNNDPTCTDVLDIVSPLPPGGRPMDRAGWELGSIRSRGLRGAATPTKTSFATDHTQRAAAVGSSCRRLAAQRSAPTRAEAFRYSAASCAGVFMP